MSVTFKMVGALRFSVLSSTFNMETFSSAEEAAEELFSAERMALRFNLFENLCLRSLQQQRDQGFEMVVATSSHMPKPYLDQLYEMTAGNDNITVVPYQVDSQYRIMRRAYSHPKSAGESHLILFRLDDDDALDVDYVARTKRLAAGLLPVQGPATPFVIAYNRGFYVQRGQAGGDSRVFDATERAPLSVGTTLVRPARLGTDNPYRFNHRKFAQHYNVFSDITVPGFIRTLHWDNHSEPAVMGLQDQLSTEEVDQELRMHFALTRDQLMRL